MARGQDELEAQLRTAFAPLATARASAVVALAFLKRVSDAAPADGGAFAAVARAPTRDKLLAALGQIVAAHDLPITLALELHVDEVELAQAMTLLARVSLAPKDVPLERLLGACDRILDGDATPWRALLQTLHRLEPSTTPALLEDTLLREGPPPEPAPLLPSLARGSQLGRYLVLELLGRGGWGEVYAAFDPELDRKIAVKVMRPETTAQPHDTEGRARLLREAQAMARLNHPNVIAVHDVGLLPPAAGERDERVFIAMELVDGVTLRQWLEDQPRSYREVLDMFVQAGRGLAAAHAAGLIHRDFKPDNVLVGRDGRARVLDFGLVRTAGTGEPDEPEATLQAALRAGAFANTPLSTPLTLPGALMGTPAYMSPEQMTGGRTDARTDQFSFCVALYRGLYGVHPFAGESMQRILVEVHSARIVAPTRPAPSWLRPIVTRGLKLDPAARFASMDALLAALAHDPSLKRRRWLMAAGALVLLGAATVGVVRGRRSLCPSGEPRLAGVWDDAKKRAVAAAFTASARPYAADALAALDHALDQFAHDYAAMFADACAATRLRGEQSEELLDLRMQCLDHELTEVRAATELFAHADGKLVENAARAAASLPAVSDCADVAALKAPVRPPSDPSVRARVEAVRGELARARAALDASKWAAGLPLAKDALTQAQAINYQPLTAESLLTLGQLQRESGDTAAASPHLVDAGLVAVASHADVTAAQAWIQRVMLAYDDAKIKEGEELAREAQAAVERTGDERLLATLDNAYAALLMEAGDLDEARRRYQQTLALRRKNPATPPLLIASTISNLGNIYLKEGKYDQAIGAYQEALALKLRVVGKDHPAVAATLNNLGNAYGEQRRFDEALDAYQRALVIWRASLGEKHRDTAMVLGNLGATLDDMGRYAEAVQTDLRVLALDEEALGPDHPDVSAARCNLAAAYVDGERPAEALPYLERAKKAQAQSIGMFHVDYSHTLSTLARAHEALGQHALALKLGQEALAIRKKQLGADAPSPPLLTTIGLAELGLNRPAQAIAPLDEALAMLRDATRPDPLIYARARFTMARALWETRRDRLRAMELAQAAARDTIVAGDRGQRERERIETWHAARATELARAQPK